MSQDRRPGTRCTKTIAIALAAGAVLFVFAPFAHAERASLSPAQLRRAASEIVLATVEDVRADVSEKDSWRVSDFTFALRVLRVDQGDLDVLDTTIHATASNRGWIGRGLPPTSGSGHRGLPKLGDRVIVHLQAQAGGVFNVVEPNGFVAAPAPIAEEIEFKGDGELLLSGTLLVPAAATAERRAPAALLLPGSGPTDRDGNQLPQFRTELLRTLAESLADHGIATLRFDKRAHMRYATSWPREPAAMAEFFSLDRFVGDAAAALRALRADERIDADRMVVIGQSEGGLIALALGSRPDNAPLRGLGLLATAGRTLDVVIREQVTRNLDEAGAPPSLREPLMASFEEVVIAVRERGEMPAKVHPALVPLFNPSTLAIMRDYFTVDPATLANGAPGSVLVLIGDADIQVSSERDTSRLVEALRARATGRTSQVVLVAVGHNLKPVARSDAFNFSGPTSPNSITAIIDWAQDATAP